MQKKKKKKKTQRGGTANYPWGKVCLAAKLSPSSTRAAPLRCTRERLVLPQCRLLWCFCSPVRHGRELPASKHGRTTTTVPPYRACSKQSHLHPGTVPGKGGGRRGGAIHRMNLWFGYVPLATGSLLGREPLNVFYVRISMIGHDVVQRSNVIKIK